MSWGAEAMNQLDAFGLATAPPSPPDLACLPSRLHGTCLSTLGILGGLAITSLHALKADLPLFHDP